MIVQTNLILVENVLSAHSKFIGIVIAPFPCKWEHGWIWLQQRDISVHPLDAVIHSYHSSAQYFLHCPTLDPALQVVFWACVLNKFDSFGVQQWESRINRLLYIDRNLIGFHFELILSLIESPFHDMHVSVESLSHLRSRHFWLSKGVGYVFVLPVGGYDIFLVELCRKNALSFLLL